MSIRYWAKLLLGPYMGRIPHDRAEKYMGIARMAYFVSVCALAGYLFRTVSPKYVDSIDRQEVPDIQDHSEREKSLRLRGVDTGVIYIYQPGEGIKRQDYNRDEYLQQLKIEARERAKKEEEKTRD